MMKRIFIPLLLLVALMPVLFSCSGLRSFSGYKLNEKDAASAIRQLLQLGARDGSFSGAVSKEMIMATVFPEPIRKVVNTASQLGITPEVDRFTTTLSTAAEQTAEKSVPIFISGINHLQFTDAVRIIKTGGTAATDYLRSSVGDSLRRSLRPVVQAALDEYKLTDQWNAIVKPLGSKRLNLDLPTLMAGLVSEMMFQKIAEKEKQVRSDAAARTTPLLQKVFSRNWNDTPVANR